MAHPIRYLRKRRIFERRETHICATAHYRGRSQRVQICNISAGGMRLDNALGLMLGDHISIELPPSRSLEGTVVWSSLPFCGVEFKAPLAEDDPMLKVAYFYQQEMQTRRDAQRA
jgi:PilZ domain